MKKFCKFTSMLMAIAMVFSLCAFSASAHELSEVEFPIDDPVFAIMQSADDFEIFETEDGALTIMTASFPTELLPQTLSAQGNEQEWSGTSYVLQPEVRYFSCIYGEGSYCSFTATNESDTADLKVTYSYFDGAEIEIPDYVSPNDSRITIIRNNNGEHLTFDFEISLSAYRCASVDWHLVARQY